MNWDTLRFVLALSRAGTLSGAAVTLGTTHTTIARRVQALQRSLGARLFDTIDGAYVVTAAGQPLLAAAERIEAELHAAEARVLGRDERLSGTLRVTTMDILFRRYERVFASFLKKHPDVELTVVCKDDEASLTRREADIALRMTVAPPEHLVGRKIGHVDFAVYASRSLARRIGRRAPFSKWPWLHWDERLGMRWLDTWLEQHAPGARVALRVDMPSTALREVIAAGFGVHFLAISEGDRDTRLVRVGGVHGAFRRDVWLLTLSELRTTSRVRAFLDHFATELRPRGSRGAPGIPS